MDDGNHTIFLNTKGNNEEDVPKEMVKFLKFVGADLEKSKVDYEDEFVKNLQDTIAHIKKSREMEERFMLLELMLKDERKQGRAEGLEEGLIKGCAENVLSLLSDLSDVPESLREKIMNETDLNTLRHWLKLAAKAESIEQFENQM